MHITFLTIQYTTVDYNPNSIGHIYNHAPTNGWVWNINSQTQKCHVFSFLEIC